jgi:putative ABC transport system permease protein
MWKTTVRNLVAHRLRLLLTAVAIVFGVAFVSGVLTLSATVSDGYRKAAATDLKDVAVGMRATDDAVRDHQVPKLDQELVDKIRALPGVSAVRAANSGYTAIVGKDGERMGGRRNTGGTTFSPGADGQDPEFRFTAGRGPVRAGEVAIDERAAREAGFRPGDRIRVVVDGPVLDELLVGTFTTDDARYELGGTITLFDRDTAQSLFGEPGSYGDIAVHAEPETTEEALLAEIAPLTPRGAETKTGDALRADQQADIEASAKGLTQSLLVFAGIALFVGTFIIANTFTMLVAQRTREFALLRAIGATRRQVSRAVLVEATALGLVSGIAGYLLGIGFCQGLRAIFDAVDAELPPGPVVVSPTAVAAALGVGVLVTVVAAWLPAHRASSIPPVAALRSDLPPSAKNLRVRNTAGALLTASGVAVVYGVGRVDDKTNGDLMLVMGGGFLALAGVIMLVPLLSTPVLRLLGRPLTAAFGVAGKLARENAVRNPRRTAATASALMIGLILVSSLSVVGSSLKKELDRVALRGISADYGVELVSGTPMDAGMADMLRGVPGVSAVSPVVSAEVGIGGTQTGVTAMDAATGMDLLHADFTEGGPEGLGTGLLVDERRAADRGWRVGSVADVVFPDGQTARLPVGGIYEPNLLLGDALMATEVLLPHLDRPLAETILVKAAPGRADELRGDLEKALGGNPAVDVMSKDDYRKQLGGIIDLLLNLLYGLLGMAIVIAVIGIVNTLAMSVFERTREIGMLRAIGMDRRRIRVMIRVEAVMISVFGSLLGMGLGLVVGVLGVRAAKGSTQMTPVVPWDRMVLFLVLAALVGMLAAAWPARGAARMEILGAVRSE